jgi:hypothetical protein
MQAANRSAILFSGFSDTNELTFTQDGIAHIPASPTSASSKGQFSK